MDRLSRKRCGGATAARVTPLEVMLDAMHMYLEAGNIEAACSVAKDAAPYVHARLAAVQMDGAIDHRYELVYVNNFYSRAEANGQ